MWSFYIIIWNMWPWTTKPVFKCTFFEFEIYRSSESWINKLSTDVWFVMIGHNIWLRYNYLKIFDLRVQKNLNIEKFAFKVIHRKFLAVYTTNQKWSWYIYGKTFIKYLHGTWSLPNILMIFGIKYKSMFNHKMYFWLLLQLYPSVTCISCFSLH